jgi:molybdenum cofactor biosynthesis enzyme MoaA
MTAEDFLEAITAMTGAGIRRVFFTGGEPLLSPLARPILRKADHRRALRSAPGGGRGQAKNSSAWRTT